MHITIIASGSLKNTPFLALFELYRKRLKGRLEVKEIDFKINEPTLRLTKETDAILKMWTSSTPLIILDEKGEEYTSLQLAYKIQSYKNQGISSLTFVIGGADGITPALKTHAAFSLSLGRLTWPHLLARVLLIEQLYRAEQILNHHPYHRE